MASVKRHLFFFFFTWAFQAILNSVVDTILVGREPMLSIVSLLDCTGRIKTPSETRLGCSKGRHNGCEIAVDKLGIVERHKRLREVPFDKFFEESSRIRLDRFEF